MEQDEYTIAEAIIIGLRAIAHAVTPNVSGGKDASGGHVESLTEAVMGITAGLYQIASSISEVSESIERATNSIADIAAAIDAQKGPQQ